MQYGFRGTKLAGLLGLALSLAALFTITASRSVDADAAVNQTQSFEVEYAKYVAQISAYEACLTSKGLAPEVSIAPDGVFHTIGFTSPGAGLEKHQAIVDERQVAMDDCYTAELSGSVLAVESLVTPSEADLHVLASECLQTEGEPAVDGLSPLNQAQAHLPSADCVVAHVVDRIRGDFAAEASLIRGG